MISPAASHTLLYILKSALEEWMKNGTRLLLVITTRFHTMPDSTLELIPEESEWEPHFECASFKIVPTS